MTMRTRWLALFGLTGIACAVPIGIEGVSRIVRDLEARHPELDEQMTRRLVGEGMQRQYGDALTSESARKGREAVD